MGRPDRPPEVSRAVANPEASLRTDDVHGDAAKIGWGGRNCYGHAYVSAKRWIESWCGTKVYDAMWRPLFDLKFYEFADNISAAWLWTRIKRVGTSRESLFQEELGYIDGGSETLVRALVDAIEKKGGGVRRGGRVTR